MLNIFLLRFNNFHKLNLSWESVKAVVLVQEFEFGSKSSNLVRIWFEKFEKFERSRTRGARRHKPYTFMPMEKRQTNRQTDRYFCYVLITSTS